MLSDAAPPCPPDVLLSLVREHAPHRAPEAFFHRVGAWRRQSTRAARSRLDAVLESFGAPEGSLAYARTDTMAVRVLLAWSAADLAELLSELRARWAAPSATHKATLERVLAVAELVRLREAGTIQPGAATRVAYLLDPARSPEPPDDVPGFFAEAQGTYVGLHAARAVLVAEAPVAWRLAAAEYARLVDRLDPPDRP